MAASLRHIDANTPMGATLVDGGATFRVWAPHATAVHVVGSFNKFKRRSNAALVHDGHGQWRGFIPGVGDRATYKFLIDGPAGPGLKRDPYARELLNPRRDCVVRASDFPWHDCGFTTPPFHEWILYQLHVGAYSAPRPQCTGTFLDVVERVPYLADLGVTAIQLLPIQEFSGAFSLGYNGTDYYAPEMVYSVSDAALAERMPRVNTILDARGQTPYHEEDLRGEMNQLKALVDICHIYGIAVVFDLVFNHAGGGFGDETLWFFDRQRGIETPLWWNSLYFSDRTWAGGVVFNFHENDVREFLINNARFFLDEYHVDGFRFDEVSVIDREGGGRGWDFCQDLTETLRSHKPDALLHAEYWPVNPWVVTDHQNNGAGFHTTMTDGPRIAIRRVLAEASIPGTHPLPMTVLGAQFGLDYLPNRWRGVNSLENHDLVMQPKGNDSNRMPRIARLADPSNARSWYARSRARVATGLLLTMPGIPLLFMGQEFLEDKPWSDAVADAPELALYWNGLHDSDPTMRDFLRFTREAIALRRTQPALTSEGFALIHAHDENRIIAFQRWVPGQGRDVIVVASFATETWRNYEIGFPSAGDWREVFNSDTYDQWVNPRVEGNRGTVRADGPPRHGLPCSARLTIPANAILAFAR
ncbi:MAG: alpha amylase C-terminal domain-containing protein [Acidobacteriaceae bacterium]|jgi:1,4-alpha-glucan branching enzyme|nr:alpha amylase C-terminal domain-containing protein [Acidobacteriaceae bacterium]